MSRDEWNVPVEDEVEPTCEEPAAENIGTDCPSDANRRWHPARGIVLPSRSQPSVTAVRDKVPHVARMTCVSSHHGRGLELTP